MCVCVCGRGMHGGGHVRARETATEAGGTHPTGMHFCYYYMQLFMNKFVTRMQ